MKSPILPLVALSVMAATAVQARDECDAPIRDWQTRDTVRDMAADRGWTLKRIKINDGCFEVYGIDKDGRDFEAKLDPATLKIVKFEERRDHR